MADYLTAADYVVRAGGNLIPYRDPTAAELLVDADAPRAIDTDRIDDAIDAASGVCQAYVPSLVDGTTEKPLADLPPALKNAIPGIVFVLARCELQDATTGDDDPVQKACDAAIETLKRLAGDPLPYSGGESPAGSVARTSRASVFSGGGGWVPGVRDEAVI